MKKFNLELTIKSYYIRISQANKKYRLLITQDIKSNVNVIFNNERANLYECYASIYNVTGIHLTLGIDDIK